MFARAAKGERSEARYHCLRVSSPYEAAAEMLAESPLAIAIDLRCLTPGDLPLIEMARQRNLEVLAVGAVPSGITTADLSGVRLSARDHLSALLDNLASASQVDESVAVPPQTAPVEAADLSALSQWIGKTPDSARKPARIPAPPPAREIADVPVGDAEADQPPRIDRPNDLLTSEELTALLEDE
jgi:hypothetical protein